ncbi:MAG TPA: methionyl-tRNA formyltransferase, partial [Bryobacteraceae bacterium]
QSLHLWRSRLAADIRNLAPGALIQDGGVFAVAGDGVCLELLELQLEGRKRMPAGVFANGHRLTNTEQLGK